MAPAHLVAAGVCALAADWLDRNGWCQFVMFTDDQGRAALSEDAKCACMTGAIRIIRNQWDVQLSTTIKWINEAAHACLAGQAMSFFNDDPDTTKDMVINRLRRMALWILERTHVRDGL